MASDTRIVYTFVASGQQTVADAFMSIERAARKSGKAVEQSTREGERAQRTAATRVEREAERIATAQKRAADKAADAQVKAAERAAAAKVRAEERAYQQMARAAERSWAQEQRAHERHQDQLRKQAERSAAAQARAQRKVGGSGGSRLLSVGGDLVLSAAATAMAVGAAAAGAVARDAMKLEEATTRLSVSSRGAGQAFVDPRQLQDEFRAVAVKTGVDAADIAGGMSSFVSKTGRLDLGRKFAETIGTTATATGASVEDVSATAADLVTKFKIEDVEDLQAAMSGLAYQGKLGAFELKDAAAQFARMGAAAASFGIGTGPQAVRVLGGLAQIARDATGSPEQASTAVEHVFSAFISKGSKIKQEGVDVFRNNKARDPRDILVDLISKAGGTDKAQKLAKMKEIFGDFGIRAVNPLVAAYGNAYDAAQGTDKQRAEAGKEAIRAALANAVDAAGDWSEVTKDAAKAQQTTSAEVSKAWNQMMESLAPIALEAMPVAADMMKQAAQAIIEAGKMLGLGPKEKTHEEKAKELDAKLSDADARLQRARKSGAPEEQITALENEVGMYQTAAAAERGQVMAPASAVFGKTMTAEEFTKKMEELGQQSGQDYFTRGEVAERAEKMARGKSTTEAGVFSLVEHPLAWLMQKARGKAAPTWSETLKTIDYDVFQGQATPEQKALYGQYAAQVVQQTGGDELRRLRPRDPATDPTNPKFSQGDFDAYQQKVKEMTEAAEKQRQAYDEAATAARKVRDALNEVKPPAAGSSGGSVVVGG